METKFKEGDVFTYNRLPSTFLYTVVKIVFEEEVITACWTYSTEKSTRRLTDSYVLTVNNSFNYFYIPISYEDDCVLVSTSNNNSTTITKIVYCPRCNAPLKDQYSEYTKSNIQKCSNLKCGWC
jgi:hypothetical protein